MDMHIFSVTPFLLWFFILKTYALEGKSHFTDEWAVNIEGGIDKAKDVARSYGFIYVDKIFEDYYLFRHSRVSKRSIYRSKFYHNTLAKDQKVKWLEQQVAKKRVKRFIPYQDFNDQKWPSQWYLNRGQGLDMNVQKAWAMGVTGKGVAVTILDDGIETEHPDLKRNYDEKASYDVNGHDPDPTPRYDYTNENRHGTRCAGEVAAQSNNSECSVGAAYDAKIGGVRMLDGDVTDSVEAHSLSLNPQHVQIYSASWGPDDDGRTVDGPATLARKAFYDGITRGRGGLGSIFVWASGNGGRDHDSCNCDGYTNSIFTLSISSATENGKIPWYSEACSSTLATTYSSGSAGERQIVTTDIRGDCTETHTGTSASAPLAAGMCALALQANPMLTWRDLQHIVVMTAKPDYLHDNSWITNGVGRKVSHSFGYGLMDAAAMVQLAKNWTTVPPQYVCEIRSPDQNKVVPMNGKISVPLYTDGCEGTSNHVKYLEHVQARITLKASRRGDVQIYLTSPRGTKSTLLAKRIHDNSREGFNNWAFMTTHNWGELAKGQWVLVIENAARSFGQLRLKDWVLVLYGTDRNPQQPITSTTTTTTTVPTTTTVKRIRKHEHDSPYYATVIKQQNTVQYNKYPPITHQQITQEQNTRHQSTNRNPSRTRNNKKQQRKNKKPKKPKPKETSRLHYHYHPQMRDGFHAKNEQHMCIFETLAKQNNMSTKQYYQMMKKDLSSAELKEWHLVVMGTKDHPQARNVSAPVNSDQPFTCSGITSHGVCIECRPGFYKLKDGCVANCPEHYYGIMQMVQLRSTTNTSSTRPKFQRQGICTECHEACRTCKGPQVADCFQCKDGYEKRDGLCQKKLLLNFLDPDMLGFFIWVIVLCIAAIILFGVIFGLLQARERQLLCWKGKRKVKNRKCEYKGMNLTQEELENDLENFDIICNRNFRHGSIPESHDPSCRVYVNNLENVVKFSLDNQSTNNLSQTKVDRSASRNSNGRYSSRNSQLDDRKDVNQDRYHCDRKSRGSSDKNIRRNYTDSYVSYDINSTLTKTLATEPERMEIPLRGQGQSHYIFHGSRSSGALLH
ncbi:furin-like protease kpc-1 isoform X2 [Mercenaria mercenaria]|uniref:furin-like protease kpc-1 isoform X2 n=1 Tax=Mercenaria mercenaria TaxID=6596 RepID=UPI00234EA04F|nr:furin-like protease kpc-1 isoform X2 [Mercenaria mercenaria]